MLSEEHELRGKEGLGARTQDPALLGLGGLQGTLKPPLLLSPRPGTWAHKLRAMGQVPAVQTPCDKEPLSSLLTFVAGSCP